MGSNISKTINECCCYLSRKSVTNNNNNENYLNDPLNIETVHEVDNIYSCNCDRLGPPVWGNCDVCGTRKRY